MRRNFCLDILLFISGLICISTGIILDFHLVTITDFTILHKLRTIHIYSGYCLSVGIVIHIAWHCNWIKAAAKQLFFSNKQEKSKD